MMTATLDDVAKKSKREPTAEERAAEEMVRRARRQGLSLVHPDGPLKQRSCGVGSSPLVKFGQQRSCRTSPIESVLLRLERIEVGRPGDHLEGMGSSWRRLPYGRVTAIRWVPRMTGPGPTSGCSRR